MSPTHLSFPLTLSPPPSGANQGSGAPRARTLRLGRSTRQQGILLALPAPDPLNLLVCQLASLTNYVYPWAPEAAADGYEHERGHGHGWAHEHNVELALDVAQQAYAVSRRARYRGYAAEVGAPGADDAAETGPAPLNWYLLGVDLPIDLIKQDCSDMLERIKAGVVLAVGEADETAEEAVVADAERTLFGDICDIIGLFDDEG